MQLREAAVHSAGTLTERAQSLPGDLVPRLQAYFCRCTRELAAIS